MFCVPADSPVSRHPLAISLDEPDAASLSTPLSGEGVSLEPSSTRSDAPELCDAEGFLSHPKRNCGSPKPLYHTPVPVCISSVR